MKPHPSEKYSYTEDFTRLLERVRLLFERLCALLASQNCVPPSVGYFDNLGLSGNSFVTLQEKARLLAQLLAQIEERASGSSGNGASRAEVADILSEVETCRKAGHLICMQIKNEIDEMNLVMNDILGELYELDNITQENLKKWLPSNSLSPSPQKRHLRQYLDFQTPDDVYREMKKALSFLETFVPYCSASCDKMHNLQQKIKTFMRNLLQFAM